jgi:putative endonuclease
MRTGGWVYVLANGAFGTLYIGVTNDLSRRLEEHRGPGGSGFTNRYRVVRLVWREWHDDITLAIQREKSLKRWRRQWKLDLITAANPRWDDLSGDIG